MVRIIEAFSALKANLEKDGQFLTRLIIIGDEFPSIPTCAAVIKSRQNDVRFLGFVPIGVSHLYDLAKIFVFPALRRFGLPLEAMAHGTRFSATPRRFPRWWETPPSW